MAAENTPTVVQLGIPTDQPRSQHDGLQSFSSYCQYCAIKQIPTGEGPVSMARLPLLARGRPHERFSLELPG